MSVKNDKNVALAFYR